VGSGERGTQAGVDEPCGVDGQQALTAAVLAAAVGDAEAHGELEHDVGAGAGDGTQRRGCPPRAASRAEVAEQAALEQVGGGRAVAQVGSLPRVGRHQKPVLRYAGGGRAGEAAQERGDVETGAVGRADLGGRGIPVHAEAAARLRGVLRVEGIG
jgi:hypothetical protein